MGCFTRNSASCSGRSSAWYHPHSWDFMAQPRSWETGVRGEKRKRNHDLVHHKRLSSYESGPKSSPGLALVGTGQELGPHDRWGLRMAWSKHLHWLAHMKKRWQIPATKCGTVWNSQFVTAHCEFKNSPSFKGNFCDGILRKNRLLSSKNGHRAGLLLSEALILWAHVPWLWH